MTYDNALTALGDPTRRAIVAMLRRGPTSVGRLGQALPVSRPAVSQHLKVLAAAGIVEAEAKGNRRIYRLSPEGIAALKAEIEALWDDALGALARRAEDIKSEVQMIDPIEKSIDLPIPPDRAFTLFIQDMATWWPVATHSLSAGAGTVPIALEIDGRVGGQITETLFDGRTAPWGTITEWQPARRFAMTWHVGRPADQASHIRVNFIATPSGCRVKLVHDNWQALGDAAAHLRENYHSGWDVVLGEYRSKAA